MKQIIRRSAATLLLVVGLLAGLGVFLHRYVADGADWADFWSNREIYRAGMLSSGTVTDRNGVTLSEIREGRRVYADSPATRQACLHVLGDMEGNIGTGVLDFFAGALAGYESLPRVGGGEPLLTLSIDEALNRAAMEALGDRRGAVLLSNYYTGEILCMYSSPSYDPLYGVDVSQARFDSVYLNRCLSVTYPPGSVFKLVTLAAAVEQLEDLDSRTFTCTGSRVVEGGTLNCHGTHGEQTVEEALANSCNCAFAELSLELGGETLAAYAEKLGLTGPVSVSGISTAAGSMETAPAGSLALAWTGVGQAKDMVCPAAMLRCVSAIANGGTAAELTILKGNYGGTTRLLSGAAAAKLKSMMNYNVNYYNEHNIYGRDLFPGLRLCGKTGTAERDGQPSHGWFVGFLEDLSHPYAVTVVVEEGGAGLYSAGGVANALLQAAVGNS